MKNSHVLGYIREQAAIFRRPNGEEYKGLSVKDVLSLADRLHVSSRIIEITALENGITPARYARNFMEFSAVDQITLLKSSVAVVGLGGLGGGVIEIFARVGVGNLILADGDNFEDTNLNRQFLSSHAKIGKSKAAAAAKRVEEINSSLEATVFNQFLDENNAEIFLSGADVIVDCLDNVATRFTLQQVARKMNVPLISSAVAGASGQLTTIYPGDQGLALIYGDPEEIPATGAEKALGCLPQAVTFFSSLECSEVIKVLLKRGETLRNRLLVADLGSNTFEIMRLL